MKGTEKQITLAKSLISEVLVRRIEKLESKRPEMVSNHKSILSAITENTEAGRVIDVLNGNSERSINMIGKHISCTIEKTLEYLNK